MRQKPRRSPRAALRPAAPLDERPLIELLRRRQDELRRCGPLELGDAVRRYLDLEAEILVDVVNRLDRLERWRKS